jgi:hypothetical protein
LAKSPGFKIIDTSYNLEFVKEILNVREETNQGNIIKIALEEINIPYK